MGRERGRAWIHKSKVKVILKKEELALVKINFSKYLLDSMK